MYEPIDSNQAQPEAEIRPSTPASASARVWTEKIWTQVREETVQVLDLSMVLKLVAPILVASVRDSRLQQAFAVQEINEFTCGGLSVAILLVPGLLCS